MKQILGIVSVIIVIGAVIFALFGNINPKKKEESNKQPVETTISSSVQISTDLNETATTTKETSGN